MKKKALWRWLSVGKLLVVYVLFFFSRLIRNKILNLLLPHSMGYEEFARIFLEIDIKSIFTN